VFSEHSTSGCHGQVSGPFLPKLRLLLKIKNPREPFLGGWPELTVRTCHVEESRQVVYNRMLSVGLCRLHFAMIRM
jgi:hypothetical protein